MRVKAKFDRLKEILVEPVPLSANPVLNKDQKSNHIKVLDVRRLRNTVIFNAQASSW